MREFYRLAQKQERKALGFLMTLYRKRLTSSFYAIRQSLQRRLDSLREGTGSSITCDDLGDLEEADDAVITGLESFIEPVDPKEIEYLEDLLRQLDNTGENSKLSHWLCCKNYRKQTIPSIRTEFRQLLRRFDTLVVVNM